MTRGAAAAALALTLLGGPGAAADSRTEAFMSGGRPVTAEWFAPGGGARQAAPAVLILHGADGMTLPERYHFGARALAAAGYHVVLVRYFERTGGRGRADWTTLRGDAPLWVETVRDAIGYVAGQPGVDAERVAVIGFSLGASLALAAAGEDSRIKAVVDLFGPVPAGAETAALTAPVLIHHGARDRIVPVEHAKRLEALLKARGVPHEVTIYPDQGHGFFGAAQIDAASRIVAFLNRHLQMNDAGAL
jgi:dienelactone hydrolase